MPHQANGGVGVQVGSGLFGVAVNTTASGSTGVICRKGEFTGLVKTSGTGEAFAVGDRLFWNSTGRALTRTSTGNLQVGICNEAVATGVIVAGRVLVDSISPAGT